MFHDLPHWAFKLLGSLLGAAVLFLPEPYPLLRP